MGAWIMAAFVLVAGFAAFTTYTIWSRKESRVRAAAVLLFLLAVPFTFGTVAAALGWPVPYIPGLTVEGGKHKIMATKIVVGDGIYFLMDSPKHAPRYYWTPWNDKLADKLQDMLNKPNGGIMLEVPYENSFSLKEPKFHELPQPKVLPDKIVPKDEPHVYERGA